MQVLRLIFLLGLAISISPLPRCAVPLAVTGENCHVENGEAAAESTAHAQGSDWRLISQPDHDETCGCELAQPTRADEDELLVPALLAAPPVLVRTQSVPATASLPPPSTAPPPAMLAVSLPLLN